MFKAAAAILIFLFLFGLVGGGYYLAIYKVERDYLLGAKKQTEALHKLAPDLIKRKQHAYRTIDDEAHKSESDPTINDPLPTSINKLLQHLY